MSLDAARPAAAAGPCSGQVRRLVAGRAVLRRVTSWSVGLSDEDAIALLGSGVGSSSSHADNLRLAVLDAADEARELVRPVVYLRTHPVVACNATHLTIGGHRLVGRPAAVLRQAQEVTAAVCTIGPALEHRCRGLMATDPVAAVALDTLGSAALGRLVDQAQEVIRVRGRSRGLEGFACCYPGSEDWPTETAQPVIFRLLSLRPSACAEVTLLPSLVMDPIKSASFLAASTAAASEDRSACGSCAARRVCKGTALHGGCYS